MKTIGVAIACGLALYAGAADAAPDVPGNKNTQAVLPTGSTPLIGDLFGVGDVDWFKVNLDRNYHVGITAKADCPNTALRLLDRNGKALASAKGFFDFPAFIGWYVTYSGLHFVEVKAVGIGNDCDPYNGAFRLTAVRECGADRRTRCEVPVGGQIESVVSAYNDRDWFKVDVPSPGTYRFIVTNPLGGPFIYDPALSLRRGDTSVISDTNRNDAHQCDPSGNDGACLRAALQSGRHYVAVRFPETEGGGYSYRLRVQPEG